MPYTHLELRKWVYTQPNFTKIFDNWIFSNYLKGYKPSIDRLDCMKPYIFDNMQLITCKDNIDKGRKEIRKYRERPILMFDVKTSDLIGEFKSSIEIEEKFNLAHVYRYALGNRCFLGNYVFRYKDLYDKNSNLCIRPNTCHLKNTKRCIIYNAQHKLISSNYDYKDKS